MKTLCGSLLAGILILAGCKKDNYDPPSSSLSGRVTYQNQPVSVRSFSSTNLGNTVTMLELYQKGYAFHTKIPVNVAQDGTYSAIVFDGDYQLVRSRGNGPWVDNSDTINVQVRGTTTMDVPVQPYYIVQNEKFQKSGASVTATVSVKQVVTGKAVDRATLFLNSTQFVDVNNNIARSEKSGADVADLSKDLSFSQAIPTTLKGACYARIGVKANGVGEYIYTPVQKIDL
jgi:hypothetical protein